MRCVLRHVARMEAIEIPDIETAQHTTLGRSKRKMVLVRACDHRGVEGGVHIDTTGAERGDQRMPHRIFVEVEAYRHGVF